MFTLKSRKDGFRLLLPKEFLCEEIVDKYAQILGADAPAERGHMTQPGHLGWFGFREI